MEDLTQTQQSPRRIWFFAWWVWIIAALFYSIEFFQRVSPSVMAEPIRETFNISASTLGAITSLYFYAYAIAQIPVGIVLDRFGVRWPLTLACLAISMGSLVFAVGQMLALLAIARVLIGLGSAFAFIGTLKLVSSWFPDRYYPLMVGLTNTLGVLGAVAGEAPFASMVNHLGWQDSLIIISVIGLGISVLMGLGIKDHPICLDKPKTCQAILYSARKGQQALRSVLKAVLLNPQTCLTAFYAGLMVAPVIAFAELWSVSFLTTAFNISNVTAAQINTSVFIGIAIGGPVNGALSRFFRSRKSVMVLGNIVALACISSIIYIPQLPEWSLYGLMFAFGFFTSSMLLAFTLNKQRHLPQHNGTVVALTNMAIMLIGAFYQWLIGFGLDHLWPQMHQAAHYSIGDFRATLTVLPLTSVCALATLLMIKDPQYNPQTRRP